mmetsp:Transcript_53916/g.114545  ORF Transcript_53916/g.114545 Transcript_53916/m.114545 type:complete len:260 (+) Transcript_53916:826-1605(+)
MPSSRRPRSRRCRRGWWTRRYRTGIQRRPRSVRPRGRRTSWYCRSQLLRTARFWPPSRRRTCPSRACPTRRTPPPPLPSWRGLGRSSRSRPSPSSPRNGRRLRTIHIRLARQLIPRRPRATPRRCTSLTRWRPRRRGLAPRAPSCSPPGGTPSSSSLPRSPPSPRRDRPRRRGTRMRRRSASPTVAARRCGRRSLRGCRGIPEAWRGSRGRFGRRRTARRSLGRDLRGWSPARLVRSCPCRCRFREALLSICTYKSTDE